MTRLWKEIASVREALATIYSLLNAHVAERNRASELESILVSPHQIQTNDDDEQWIATFSGDVPRVGETIWTDEGAWKVVDVAWFVRSVGRGHTSRPSARVFVEPLRAGCKPNKVPQ